MKAWILLTPLLLVGCVRAPVVTTPVVEGVSSADVSGEGLASWYGAQFAGKKTASGALFDPNALTAAHRTLKFGTCVKVELVSCGRTVEVRVNDRGPFVTDRIIDVSEEAAKQLGLIEEGVGKVRLSPCG